MADLTGQIIAHSSRHSNEVGLEVTRMKAVLLPTLSLSRLYMFAGQCQDDCCPPTRAFSQQRVAARSFLNRKEEVKWISMSYLMTAAHHFAVHGDGCLTTRDVLVVRERWDQRALSACAWSPGSAYPTDTFRTA